jgi:hypothetical protein
MSEHHNALPLDPLGPLPIQLERHLRSVVHTLANNKRALRKCTCAGGEVPFYCRAHGRVENPNWPLLKQAR